MESKFKEHFLEPLLELEQHIYLLETFMADFVAQLQTLKDELTAANVSLAEDRKAALDSLARADLAATDASTAKAKVDALALKDDAMVAANVVTDTKAQTANDNLAALIQTLIDAHVIVKPEPAV
jgi:hypothetical protein